jgi:hypothetical protein
MLSPNPFLTTADTAVELDRLDLFKPPAAVMRRDALHQGTGAAYVPQLTLIRALQVLSTTYASKSSRGSRDRLP